MSHISYIHRLLAGISILFLGCLAMATWVFAETENQVGYQKATGTGSNGSFVETVGTTIGDPIYTANTESGTSVVNE